MRPSRIISVLFHPVIMPMAGTFILLTYGGWLSMLSHPAKQYIYMVVGTTTLLIPLIVFPALIRFRVIADFRTGEQAERRIPLLILSMFYLLAAFILQKVEAPGIIPLYLNGTSMVFLCSAIVNWRWKISIFMAAIGALTGMVLAISLRWLLNTQLIIGILFLIAGLTGYARLKDEAHSPAEVYAGYLLGFAMNFLLIWLI